MSFFLFRCDASLEIGTGHVMRCLTLANALRLQGSVCRFVCKEFPGNLQERIKQDGFEVVCLPPALSEITKDQEVSNLPQHFPWLGGSWKDDAEKTIAAIGPNKPSWLIVDHYGIDSRWEKFLRPHVEKIMVIDDLADREHDCDLLLDQNLVANMDQRYEGLLPKYSVRLLGPKYALLQPEYAELRKKAKVREGPVKRILVYFGGADKDNLTGMAISALKNLRKNEIRIDVVVNPLSPHLGIVRKEAEAFANIYIHEGMPSLAPLIVDADLFIGAGGTTSWERCCLGLPTIVVSMAPNQTPIIEKLQSNNCLIKIDGCSRDLVNCMQEVIYKKPNLLYEMSVKCFGITDGLGSLEVAAKMNIY